MAASSGRDPVGRALDLLTWLAENGTDGPLGVREIARAMGSSPTTVHRLLQAFEERSRAQLAAFQPAAQQIAGFHDDLARFVDAISAVTPYRS